MRELTHAVFYALNLERATRREQDVQGEDQNSTFWEEIVVTIWTQYESMEGHMT